MVDKGFMSSNFSPASTRSLLRPRIQRPLTPAVLPRLYSTPPPPAHTPLAVPLTKGAEPQSRWRSFLQILGRVTLGTIVLSAGTFYYVTQRDRNPGAQLPHDDSKKTLVVLGSGWGATSLLKALDTTEWNVVSFPSAIKGLHADQLYAIGGGFSQKLLPFHTIVT